MVLAAFDPLKFLFSQGKLRLELLFCCFSFKLPATHKSFNVRKASSALRKDQIVYRLKEHQRIVQVGRNSCFL